MVLFSVILINLKNWLNERKKGNMRRKGRAGTQNIIVKK